MAQKPKARKSTAKGGRPEHAPTLENRQTVEQMRYCGESEATIARALGLNAATLKKHYAEELLSGHAARRREVVAMLFKAAREGNATSIKKLEEMGRGDGGSQSASTYVGKKEQQSERAREVGQGRFATPEAPKLIVDNK